MLALILAACGAPEDQDAPGVVAPEPIEKLRDGTVTAERPEVGRVEGCTATLVAPDVAITAAFCVKFGSRDEPGRYTLSLTRAGETRRFAVARYRSFGPPGAGPTDVALLGLAEAVPADFASPAPLARATPEPGSSLTVYGYGCAALDGAPDGHKRRASFAQGEAAQHICPGDTGGPVFHDALGAIARINSGLERDAGRTDIHGLVPPLYDALVAQIRAWTRGELPEEGSPTPPDDDAQVCGRDLQVFAEWTCTGTREHRYRCPEGATQIWEECLGGCEPRANGPDACAGEPPPAPEDVTPPEVRVVSPADGARVAPGERAVIEALVHDDGALAGVHLVWAFNQQAYACPSSSPAADCEVDGDRYRWTVRVENEGARRFVVRARDAGGNERASAPRTIIVAPEQAPPPDDEDDVAPPPEDEGAPPPEDPQDPPLAQPDRPPPPNVPDAPDDDGRPPLADNGVPTVEVLAPTDGEVFGTDSTVEVSARITDAEGITGAHLLWAFNGNRYACPSADENVRCEVDGDVRRWTVRVGTADARPFRVSARNRRGRTTTTPERTILVREEIQREDPDAEPPRITLLDPRPDTVWRANSTVRVTARITADAGVRAAALLWDYNDNEYACPSQSRYVTCAVEGDRYVWDVQVGRGTRAFQVRATDNRDRATLSERLSLELQE